MLSRKTHGFSLVELSIVLVILGLLAGGILAGQSLIRASQLRAVGTEYNRYVMAVGAFEEKFGGLPGDLKNANTYWGAADGASGSTAGCATTAGTGTQTCNGNGDGFIYPSTSSNESFRFWQHLVNAGLIEGSYDGITHGAGATTSTSANSPASRLGSPALWWVWYYPPLSGSSVAFDGPIGNFFVLGTPVANNPSNNPSLKPEEMWNIDTKMDDGKPATGNVVIMTNSGLASCTDTGTSSNMSANYLLSSSAVTCAPLFRQAF